jgi:hypothetical protein
LLLLVEVVEVLEGVVVEVRVDTVHLLALAAAGLLPNRLFLLP